MAQIFRFPVNVIKVDRELVRNLLEDEGSRIITEAIRGIAQASGKGLILEGVEDHSQLTAIQSMGCKTVQGYLYSKPLTASAIPEFLSAYPPQ